MNRDKLLLEQAIKEMELLDKIIGDTSREDFLADEVLKRAVSMSVINVGELIKRLSADFFDNHTDENIHMAAKTRDYYAHGYFSLSFEDVYDTATEDYPELCACIKNVLENEFADVEEDS